MCLFGGRSSINGHFWWPYHASAGFYINAMFDLGVPTLEEVRCKIDGSQVACFLNFIYILDWYVVQ